MVPTPSAAPGAPLALPASSATMPPIATNMRLLNRSPAHTVAPSADNAQPKDAEIIAVGSGCGKTARPQVLFPMTVAMAPVDVCTVRTKQPVVNAHADTQSVAPSDDRPSAAGLTPLAIVVTPSPASTRRIALFAVSPTKTRPPGVTARPAGSLKRANSGYPWGTSKNPATNNVPARSAVPAPGVTTRINWLYLSATYTRPNASMPTPCGWLKQVALPPA